MTRLTAAEYEKLLQNNPDLQTDVTHSRRAKEFVQRKQSEHDMQVALIKLCDELGVTIFAIPNGGQRNPVTAVNLKAEGVRAGVPDLFIPEMRHGYGGLFLELKVGDNKPTDSQKQWIRKLRARGYYCSVIWDSVDEAIAIIQWYLHGETAP